jgi:hypothetical protein
VYSNPFPRVRLKPPAADGASAFPRSSLRGVSLKWLKNNKPRGWRQVPTREHEGWTWLDENGVERLRYMRPSGSNPANSQWSRQANGYFRWQDAKGTFLDVKGSADKLPAVPRTHTYYV